MILAIVGSTRFDGDEEASKVARAEIAHLLYILLPDEIISGGAKGIDTIAKEEALNHLGLPESARFKEFLPKHPRWEPDGYKARNLLIAQYCTHLVSIRHDKSYSYGSGWTADRAEELGKPVRRYMYDSAERTLRMVGRGD